MRIRQERKKKWINFTVIFNLIFPLIAQSATPSTSRILEPCVYLNPECRDPSTYSSLSLTIDALTLQVPNPDLCLSFISSLSSRIHGFSICTHSLINRMLASPNPFSVLIASLHFSNFETNRLFVGLISSHTTVWCHSEVFLARWVQIWVCQILGILKVTHAWLSPRYLSSLFCKGWEAPWIAHAVRHAL